ncbi:unnamed protein product [Ectocarpus sp. 12 AP-2014]
MCALAVMRWCSPCWRHKLISPHRGEINQTVKGTENMYAISWTKTSLSPNPSTNLKADFSGNPLPGFRVSRNHNYEIFHPIVHTRTCSLTSCVVPPAKKAGRSTSLLMGKSVPRALSRIQHKLAQHTRVPNNKIT